MTDFDATNEGAPTEPLPIADGTAPTAPLPPSASENVTAHSAFITPPEPPTLTTPAGAISEGAATAQAPAAEHRPWRPSTGGIVALAIAGGLLVSTVSFGAGWGTHGFVSRFHQAHGFAAGPGNNSYRTPNGSGSFGTMPNGGQAPDSDSDSQAPNGNSSQAPDSDGSQSPNDGGSYGGRGMGPHGGWGGQSAPESVPMPNQQGLQQDGAQDSAQDSYVCPGMTW